MLSGGWLGRGRLPAGHVAKGMAEWNQAGLDREGRTALLQLGLQNMRQLAANAQRIQTRCCLVRSKQSTAASDMHQHQHTHKHNTTINYKLKRIRVTHTTTDWDSSLEGV